jgi:threonine dehydratase
MPEGATVPGFAAAARAAMQEMRPLFPPTPLLRNDHLSRKHGADIWLKREDLSPVRSYKIRGALNAMRKAVAAGAHHFVCASTGNHAQGMAFACRHFGVRGTIYMPVTTPQQKIDKTAAFGGEAIEIVLEGDYVDDTLRAAKATCDAIGARFLSPFDDDDVIEGQASVAVEILDAMESPPDIVVLPVGGGGLAAGMRRLFDEEAPETEFAYVEPAGGASLAAALAAGHPVRLERLNTFVDGAAVAQIGARPFAVLAGIDRRDVRLAPEDRVCVTILEMLNVEGIVLEPAGALAVDALGDLAGRIAGRRVVCVTSGGNFDFERLPEVKERSQRYSGIKKYLILRLPQRPGALRDFLGMLGPHDDIARFEYLKKSARNFGSVLIGIEAQHADDFRGLFARMDAAGYVYRDITGDETLANFLV